MDELDVQIKKGKGGLVVALLVIVGVAVVGVGGYLAWKKRQGSGPAPVNQGSLESWCKLRQEWARKVNPLAGDIMLKSVEEKDKEARDKLITQRNQLCQDYAEKVRNQLTGDAELWALVRPVEEVLIREGKTRANVAVEIANALARSGAEDSTSLGKDRDKLSTEVQERIKKGRARYDKEVQTSLERIKGISCSGLYRGPMTDQGTNENPYQTWDELEMKRSVAVKVFDERIKALQPLEEFANRVYHELVAKHRKYLTDCYKKIKRINAEMSDTLGLRIRLKPNGQVRTLAIEWMAKRDERLLDCLLENAARWHLPPPEPEIEMAVVTVDFTKL